MAILCRALVGALAAATTVIAHSHVNNLVINGVYWQGYDPTTYAYESDPPIVVGWTAADLDNGFVSPDAFQTDDIICQSHSPPHIMLYLVSFPGLQEDVASRFHGRILNM